MCSFGVVSATNFHPINCCRHACTKQFFMLKLKEIDLKNEQHTGMLSNAIPWSGIPFKSNWIPSQVSSTYSFRFLHVALKVSLVAYSKYHNLFFMRELNLWGFFSRSKWNFTQMAASTPTVFMIKNCSHIHIVHECSLLTRKVVVDDIVGNFKVSSRYWHDALFDGGCWCRWQRRQLSKH